MTLTLAGPLYKDLAFYAQRSGMDADAFATQLLAQAIGQLEGRRPPRPARPEVSERPRSAREQQDEDAQPRHHEEQRRPGGGGGNRGRGRGGRGGQGGGGHGGGRREGYRPEMENQADFLAYVRDMEKGGGGGGGRGRGGR